MSNDRSMPLALINQMLDHIKLLARDRISLYDERAKKWEGHKRQVRHERRAYAWENLSDSIEQFQQEMENIDKLVKEERLGLNIQTR